MLIGEENKKLIVFFSAFFNWRSNLVLRFNSKHLEIIERSLRHSIRNLLKFLNLTDFLWKKLFEVEILLDKWGDKYMI